MTIQQLEYILALDNYRSFVKASEATFVTQPTLSMQIKKLEEETGFLIFDRSKKPLEPTVLGKKFINKSRQVIREINELKTMISQETESLSGNYRLGIIPTLAPYLLPLFLPVFIENFPEIHLQIEELQSEVLIEALKNDRLDIGILATPVYEKQIREIPMFNEPFLALFPEGDPHLKVKHLVAGKLELKRLMILAEGHCFRNQTLNLCKPAASNNNKSFEYQSGSIETLKELVKKGVGYTLVPEMSVLNEININPNLRRFQSPEPSREVSIVVHKNFSRERFIEVLRDTILHQIPEHFSKQERFFRVKWR